MKATAASETALGDRATAPEPESRDRLSLGRLAATLLAVAPLVGALPVAPRVTAPGAAAPSSARRSLQAVLDRLAAELEVAAVEVVDSDADLTAAELVISEQLELAELLEVADDLANLPDPAVEDAICEARSAVPASTRFSSPDGTVLRCYSVGPPDARTVIIVSACGMPVGLVSGWLDSLAASFRVLTWESRGLFGDAAALEDPTSFDGMPHDLASQAGDVASLMASFGVETAHLMGLCGGAPIALAAAGAPGIESLSLWHGDFELAGRAPKTLHQRDIEAMLTMAARGRPQARSLHHLFQRPSTASKLRRDVAHHLFYPYASPELLYRYGHLNGAIMKTDCSPFLATTTQPTLVVSAEKDTTAHPEGSIFVAERLAEGRLVLNPDGDHLAAFDAAPASVELARSFISDSWEA